MNLLNLARQLVALLRCPPTRSRVYQGYNITRRGYILQSVGRHFGRRDDDPAPLYGKTLLDVGCGDCTIAEYLALSGGEVTAIDPDTDALGRASTRAEAFGAPIRFIRSRAEDLVAGTQRYDVILALDILEETPDPKRLLWVLSRLLNPGGILVFSAINRSPKAWLVHKVLSEYVYRRVPLGRRRYRRFYRPRQLANLARHVGLKLDNIQGLSFSLSERAWRLRPRPDTRYLATATVREKPAKGKA